MNLVRSRINKNGLSGIARAGRAGASTNRVNPAGFAQRWKAGKLAPLTQTRFGKTSRLRDQFALRAQGDVARRLSLGHGLERHGGWRTDRISGRVSPHFTRSHFGHFYPGPRLYPSYCWYPRWSPWVDWCWWSRCSPYYDPRPIFCQPYIYGLAPTWSFCNYPIWIDLPIVASGTWVDVPPVAVADALDLQLLAVRFVDAGHPEQNLGPRYRLWVRNNSDVDINQPFSVLLMASNDDRMAEDLPQTSVLVDKIAAGKTQPIDVRLPAEANSLGRDEQGRAVPFTTLHAVVDSGRQIAEQQEANNGTILPRENILPVDPTAFSTDVDKAKSGEQINIAGEGLGPEPGRVVVYVAQLELEAEILGWFDLGVRVRLPELPLANAASAEIVIIRGDGTATTPLPLTILPEGAALVAPPELE